MTDAADAPPATSHAFQADVARLLHLMVHSIYTERDIFLRELISNAADACEKLRYEALANPALAGEKPFAITLVVDKEAGTLAVADNGVGMSRQDLESALGTIASSGTRAFLDKIAQSPRSEEEQESEGGKGAATGDLIGQFGIGFYSAFMVADRVTVETRRAGGADAWTWESDGKGAYTIAPLDPATAPPHGTRVILHLNEQSKDYLEPWRVEQIVREHSSAVATPIEIKDKPDAEPRALSDGAALWTKPKSAVTPEQYADFYRSLGGVFDDPALTAHWRAEGRYEYTALAFVPGSRPFDLFDPSRKGKAKLYVRRVLISDEADLLPGFLRFAKLVVDASDLPLNVSREMIQESAMFAAIKRGVANRLVQELTRCAASEPETFAKIWENFGPVLKEGLYEEPERRDALFKFARFATLNHPDKPVTLEDYVAALRPNQTAIYYLAGDDLKRLAASPQLEGFRQRGIDVLLLPDPVDAFWTTTAVGFDGKPFKSVTQGAADIKIIPMKEGEAAPQSAEPDAPTATLFAFMKQTLETAVADVRASDRLFESAACLVAPEGGPDRRLERMLAQHGKLGAEASKPLLEINPNHALVKALASKFSAGQDRALVEDAAWLLYDEARLLDGEALSEPAAFAQRLTRVLEKAAGA